MPYQYTHKAFVKGPEKVKLVAGAEAVIAELTGIDVGPTNGSVILDASAVVTTVAESSQVQIRIRRASLTGTIIASTRTKPGASTETEVAIQGEDKPGECSGQKYVLTLEDVAGKAAESIFSTLEATW